ncbi:hypothetical protein [Xanthomonas vasicola]|uniref:hypothetical protein n=1 Tax=Xanthomonas vasicola TaxID=56459 RepID=UPI00052C3272|nr:hypothetical protein [Xanthomonas vasicola]
MLCPQIDLFKRSQSPHRRPGVGDLLSARTYAGALLSMDGYRVVLAADGAAALHCGRVWAGRAMLGKSGSAITPAFPANF